jgi:hypothetical protein
MLKKNIAIALQRFLQQLQIALCAGLLEYFYQDEVPWPVWLPKSLSVLASILETTI